MTTLIQAICEKIAPVNRPSEADVKRVLDKHLISTSASVPAPARLRATRLRFNGKKFLTGVSADGETTRSDAVEEVSFSFDWTLASGLYGVGSDKNLRGKSSVLRVLMWALRGRCDLQPEVRNWIDHVDLDFSIDNDNYRVSFDIDHDNHDFPHGVLVRTRLDTKVTIGSFNRPEEFESVMGGAMMSALGLPIIAAQTEGTRTQHAWPTYAGALIIRGDNLDNLLGDVRFAGLPGRLLSMFLGTQWAAARAEATTAVSLVEAAIARMEKAASSRAEDMREGRTAALQGVEKALERLHAIQTTTLDHELVLDTLQEIPRIDAEAIRLARLLQEARREQNESEAQLKAEQARRHHELEDAVAIRFFQNLRPTSCPRCSAPVTEERLKAESSGETCSVCVTDIDLGAHEHNLVLSSAISAGELGQTVQTLSSPEYPPASDSDIDNNIEEIVDDLTALVEATRVAEQRTESLAMKLQAAEAKRSESSAVVASIKEAELSLQMRHEAALTLARAEGAASAFAPGQGMVGSSNDEIMALQGELRFLIAARDVTTKWVHKDQAQKIADLETSIVSLARSFGMPNLTQVKLSGNTTMRVTKGGSENPYGKTERGEKVRLKLATAIALIQHGRTAGVGRHPGLLIIDSPGAEEINEDDFDTMLEALNREAKASDIQIFIGTRHTDELINLLGESRCRIGRGNNFVW